MSEREKWRSLPIFAAFSPVPRLRGSEEKAQPLPPPRPRPPRKGLILLFYGAKHVGKAPTGRGDSSHGETRKEKERKISRRNSRNLGEFRESVL